MRSVQAFGASSASAPLILQSGAIRRRVTASDAVATLVAELAFGEPSRGDLAALASVTASRVADAVGAR